MTGPSININLRQYLELDNLASGVFSPLSGFMKEDEFNSVVNTMRLLNGQLFPLPVALDLSPDQVKMVARSESVTLRFQEMEVGEIIPESVYTCDKETVAQKIFGTKDTRHSGVAHFMNMGEVMVGGPVTFHQPANIEFSEHILSPANTREHFRRQGWKSVVGFQTRNVPHRAHEYLLRRALEQADGLFIQPLVGTKKRGDYTPMAVLAAYRKLIDDFLPKERILLGVLSTAMRYAGPKEAILHAIIRRNYGCSHFIVGRDHAGVGDFYGKYEAQELTRKFDGELGIQILRLPGPFYCNVCAEIVTELTCPHASSAPDRTQQVSGTFLRSMLENHGNAAPELIRPEIVESIRGLKIFIEEEAD